MWLTIYSSERIVAVFIVLSDKECNKMVILLLDILCIESVYQKVRGKSVLKKVYIVFFYVLI